MALNQIYHFNPRAPCGARPDGARLQRQKQYFNPRAPCGARLFVKVFGTDILLFQPTRPLRGATRRERFFMEVLLYFNPRAPCGARPEGGSSFKVDVWISTHAPLAGRDLSVPAFAASGIISTHAPLAGRDCRFKAVSRCRIISTHAPLAGRDERQAVIDRQKQNFNPRAPCGARRSCASCQEYPSRFQPTRPLRGATSG